MRKIIITLLLLAVVLFLARDWIILQKDRYLYVKSLEKCIRALSDEDGSIRNEFQKRQKVLIDKGHLVLVEYRLETEEGSYLFRSKHALALFLSLSKKFDPDSGFFLNSAYKTVTFYTQRKYEAHLLQFVSSWENSFKGSISEQDLVQGFWDEQLMNLLSEEVLLSILQRFEQDNELSPRETGLLWATKGIIEESGDTDLLAFYSELCESKQIGFERFEEDDE